MISNRDRQAQTRERVQDFREFLKTELGYPPQERPPQERTILDVIRGTNPADHELAAARGILRDIRNILGPLSATLLVIDEDGQYALDINLVHRDRHTAEQVQGAIRAATEAHPTRRGSRPLAVLEGDDEYLVPLDRRQHPVEPDANLVHDLTKRISRHTW